MTEKTKAFLYYYLCATVIAIASCTTIAFTAWVTGKWYCLFFLLLAITFMRAVDSPEATTRGKSDV